MKRSILSILLSITLFSAFGQAPADVNRQTKTPLTGTYAGSQSVRDFNLTAVGRFHPPKFANNSAFLLVKGKDSTSIYWNTTIERLIIYKQGGTYDTVSTSAASLYLAGYGILKTGNTFRVDSSLVSTKSWANGRLLSYVGLSNSESIAGQKRFLPRTYFGNGTTTGETWIGKHQPGDGTLPSYPPAGDVSAVTVRNPTTGNYISMSEYEFGMTINFRSIQPHGTRALEFHSDYGDGVTPNFHAIATLIGQADQNSFQVRDVGDGNGLVLRSRLDYPDLFEITTEHGADVLVHMPVNGVGETEGKLRIQAQVVPEQTDTWSLGSPILKWKNLNVSDSVRTAMVSSEAIETVVVTTAQLNVGYTLSDPENGLITATTADSSATIGFTDGSGGHDNYIKYSYAKPNRFQTAIGDLAVLNDFASGQSIGASALGTTLQQVLTADSTATKGASLGRILSTTASNAAIRISARTANEPQISFEDVTGSEQTGSLLAYNFNFMTNGTTRVGIGHAGEVEVAINAGTPLSVVRNQDLTAYSSSLRVVNTTGTPFTKATLNSTYPSSPIGMKIICTSIGFVYEKYDATNWFSTAVTIMP